MAGSGPNRSTRAVALLSGLMVGFAALFGGLTLGAQSREAARCRVPEPGWSAARAWNEATLEAIRHDLPAPTVHARNLFHVSVAMWDAWAAYEDGPRGYLTTEKHAADEDAQREAVSYAAYRVLSARYLASVGASDSLPAFDALMDSLCLRADITTTEGDSPAAVGNRAAAEVLAAGLRDASNEAGRYAAPDYSPVNPPLVVAQPGATVADPDRWQPLQIAQMVSQNGIPVEDGVQSFISPHWGHVEGFALPPGGEAGTPIDPGPPPRVVDPATSAEAKAGILDVIRYSSQLDPADAETVDVSPGAMGANPLGTYAGKGRTENPITGEPYAPEVVLRADYERVVAEFWADGPKSETPPGHWNVLANEVSDRLDPDLRVGGEGPRIDRLEWDVTLYLALNGATHDAAVAAWGLKGAYDSARPISLIRYLGGLGQSSDPALPSYDPRGLPLEPGLVEVVTAGSSAAGQPHEAFAGQVGTVVVRSWAGRPMDPENDVGGVRWIRAVEWLPYQMPSFVTPAFAAYVSGHSTFSRASAEVLTAMTGSPYFPGGLFTWTEEQGSLDFEAGPTTDVTLQWATYADAADQAGISRLFGGIHVPADDLTGREIGYECGRAAWVKAMRYFRPGDGGGA